MLALLVPLRRGDPAQFERFAGYADAMLAEREFFIRKAIGWVLRETGKRQPGPGRRVARAARAAGLRASPCARRSSGCRRISATP